ncbi:MAG TPA: MBL fold metallo-hydrolase [Thermomicrobiales bacterium]|jgi:glyoxylase-like metal-dependent hydrolase (beta-lactamase superfamily II)
MAAATPAPRPLALEIVAVPNTGPLSEEPTNAIIIGTNEVFIVDPGDEAGVELIQAALVGRGAVTVKAILLTHAHPDHAVAAPALQRRYGCPIMLGPREVPVMRDYLDWSTVEHPLVGGMTLAVAGGHLDVLDTPGHTPGHIAFYEPTTQTLLAGDLVAGHGTVGILYPHGKMRDYFASLRLLQGRDIRRIIPGHGQALTQPPDLFGQYLERRTARERSILAIVGRGPTTVAAILPELYPALAPQSREAAVATIIAHLEKLQAEGHVTADAADLAQARWRVSG